MKDANLEISFKPLDEPNIEGIEFVEFLISPNKGEPLKSLNKIASGGELSRIMLALKVYLFNLEDKQLYYSMKLIQAFQVKQLKNG